MMFFILHGFGSATPNAKSAYIEDTFPNDTVINLNYDFDPKYGVGDLDTQVDKAIADNKHETEFVFLGTSLGGFYAQYLANRFGGKAIAVNPSVNPSTTLHAYIGTNKNFATGKTFDFTADMANGYARYTMKLGVVPTLILLDMGDELIDASDTINHFAGYAQIKTFEGGSHRFEHLLEATDTIKTFVRSIAG